MEEHEKRKSSRVRLVLEVNYLDEREAPPDYLTDLGENGLFLSTTQPFAVGQWLSFTIGFPGILDPVEVEGLVRWKRQATFEESAGVGIELIFTSAEDEAQVSDLLRRTQARLKIYS